MNRQWKSVVMIAALALCMGIAAPAWSQVTPSLADPMAEDYAVHVIPFYRIDANWSSFLVIADTSYRDLDHKGSRIDLKFFDAACNLRQDAQVKLTTDDAQFFALHDPTDANGQFTGIPAEGVITVDGDDLRIITYILLVNGNNNSLIRIDSIPCQGQGPENNGQCDRREVGEAFTAGRWLRYDSVNTIAATFGDSGAFRTNLYFFSARGELRTELLAYGFPRHNDWASRIHLDGYCDEIYLGSRFRDLACTQRVSLSSLNYTLLNTFPDDACAGKPGHIVTFASDNGIDFTRRDYSGFQETIASLVPGANLIGTGYYHHSENTCVDFECVD